MPSFEKSEERSFIMNFVSQDGPAFSYSEELGVNAGQNGQRRYHVYLGFKFPI